MRWLVQGYFYYIFGFCFVVGMLTVLITVEVAIVCTYVQLCAEDYLWWYASEPCTTHISLLAPPWQHRQVGLGLKTDAAM